MFALKAHTTVDRNRANVIQYCRSSARMHHMICVVATLNRKRYFHCDSAHFFDDIINN